MTKNDAKIKLLLAKIETEREKLGTKPRVAWQTNCLFRYDDKKYFNLNTVNTVDTLVDAMAFLLNKHMTYEQAAKRLNVPAPTLTWSNYSLEAWEHDFVLKAKLIDWAAQQKKLKALEKKLKELVSEEAKTEMALDEIANLLGQ